MLRLNVCLRFEITLNISQKLDPHTNCYTNFQNRKNK